MLYKKIGIVLIRGLYEYMLVFPVVFLISIKLFPEQFWQWLILLFVLFLCGYAFRAILLEKSWWMYVIVAAVFAVLPCFVLAPEVLKWILLIPIQYVFTYRGMVYAENPYLLRHEYIWIGGGAMYFISYFLYRYFDWMNTYLPLLTILGILVICMAMFVSNNENLKTSSLSKQTKPYISKTIRQQNRFFLFLMFGVILLVAYLQVIRDVLLGGIRALFQWLFSGESEPIAEEPESPPPSMEMGFPALEEKERSAFMEFILQMFTYVSYVLAFAAVVLLLLLLVKKVRQGLVQGIRHFFAFLKQLLTRRMEQDEEMDYIDEKENLFNWNEWKQEQQEKAKGIITHWFQREPRWDTMSSHEKVRWIFRKFVQKQSKKGPSFPPSLTAREMVKQITTEVEDHQVEELLEAYEITRYGEQNVENEKIEKLREMTE